MTDKLKTVIVHLNGHETEQFQVNPKVKKFTDILSMVEEKKSVYLPSEQYTLLIVTETISSSALPSASTTSLNAHSHASLGASANTGSASDLHSASSATLVKRQAHVVKKMNSTLSSSKHIGSGSSTIRIDLFPPLSPFHRVFGVPMEIALLRAKMNGSATTQETEMEIPGILRAAFEFLETRGYDEEGIFRLSGSNNRIRELVRQLNSGILTGDEPTAVIFPKKTDPHLVAGIIKLYLRELPDPLLTFARFEQFILLFKERQDPISHDDLLERTRQLIITLPNVHRAVLSRLMCLLHRISSEYEKETKMTTENLATVVGPNILYMPDEETHEMANNRMSIRTRLTRQTEILPTTTNCCNFLIKHYKEIFEQEPGNAEIRAPLQPLVIQAPSNSDRELEELQAKLNEARQKLANQQKLTESFKGQCDAKQVVVQQLQMYIQQGKQDVEKLQNDLQEARSQESQNGASPSEIESFERKEKQMQNMVEKLKTSCENLEKQVALMQEEKKKLDAAKLDSDKQIHLLKQKLEAETTSHDEMSREIDHLKSDSKKDKQLLEKITKDRDMAKKDAESSREAIALIRKELESLQKRSELTKQELSKQKIKYSEMEQELTTKKEKLEEKSKQLQRIEQELSTECKEKKSLLSEVENSKIERTDLVENISVLRQEMVKLNDELKQSNEKFESLRSELVDTDEKLQSRTKQSVSPMSLLLNTMITVGCMYLIYQSFDSQSQ